MKLAQVKGGRTPLVRIAVSQEIADRVVEVLTAANTDGLKLVGSHEQLISEAIAAFTGSTPKAAPKASPLKGRKLGPRKPKDATEAAPPAAEEPKPSRRAKPAAPEQDAPAEVAAQLRSDSAELLF